MTISISGQVPAEAQNGMAALESKWTEERTPDELYAVVKIARHGLSFKDADQTWAATMKFTAIEPILDTFDVATAKRLLEDACSARGGAVQLTLDGVDGVVDPAAIVDEANEPASVVALPDAEDMPGGDAA